MKNLSGKFSNIPYPLFLMIIGLFVFILNAAFNGKYGFHRDELDMLMNARRLAWGYVAYPPITPFIARLGLDLFGFSLFGIRLLPALAQGIAAILVALMAKDMGGDRKVQFFAAIGAAIAPVALVSGTMIQYMSFDFLCWVLVSFCFIRLIHTENPRWWIAVGASIGLGMMTKYTIAFFIAGLGLSIMLTPTRKYLRSTWLWAGVGTAVIIFLPNLIWQVQHHFISLEFLSSIHARDIAWGRTDEFLIDQLYATSNPLMLPVWVAGLVYLLFTSEGKKYRAPGIMFLVTFLLLLLGKGRGYYVGPAYPMLIAAGAVWIHSLISSLKDAARIILRSLTWILLGLGAIIGIVLMKPIFPVSSPGWKSVLEINDIYVEMIGWDDLAKQVADVYNTLSAEEKQGTVILAGNYGEAGAMEFYGGPYNLPRMISGSNSLWSRGYGDQEPQTLIVVGFEKEYAGNFFNDCTKSARVSNRYGVLNEETEYHNSIYICRGLKKPWKDIWPTMQWFQ